MESKKYRQLVGVTTTKKESGTDMENKPVVTSGGWGEQARWGRGLFKKGLLQDYIKPCAYFKCITSKGLLHSPGNSVQDAVIT